MPAIRPVFAVTIALREGGAEIGVPGHSGRTASAAWLRRLARTTPGVIGIIALAVAAVCVIAGVVCGAQLNGRIDERNAVLTRSEPFAYAAQNLYAALSAADAAAASAFLSGGIETAPMRDAIPTSLGARRVGTRRRDRRHDGYSNPHRDGGDIGATGGVHRTRRSGTGEQPAGLPDRFRLLARSIVVDADVAASRGREGLHRQSRHGQGRPARHRFAADRQPRAAGARPRGDRCRFGDHVSAARTGSSTSGSSSRRPPCCW